MLTGSQRVGQAGRRWWRLSLGICLGLVFWLGSLEGNEEAAGAVKAAFVYRFLFFVEGIGEGGDGVLRVGVLGDEGMVALFRRHVEGRRGQVEVQAIVLETATLPAALSGCNVVFVGEGVGEEALEVLDRGLRPGVLLVTDSPRVFSGRGEIYLFRQDNRYRFDVHLGRARERGVRLQSKLVRLADRILEGEVEARP